MGRGGGSRAAGAIAHMEMGEVFKTAGFRRARGRARGSCGDADRDDARRAVDEVDAACQSSLSSLSDPFARRLAVAEGSLGDFERCQLFAAIARA